MKEGEFFFFFFLEKTNRVISEKSKLLVTWGKFREELKQFDFLKFQAVGG